MSQYQDFLVVNPESIQNLRDIDLGLVKEVIVLFLNDSPPRITAISAAFDNADAKGMAQQAHALKSAAGNLGADRVSKICKDLEILGNSGDLAKAKELVAILKSEFEICSSELKKIGS